MSDETMGGRIQRMIDRLGFSQRSFAREIDENAANINNWTRGTVPSATFFEKVARRFPDVSLRWLITGEGDMMERRRRQEVGLIDALARQFVLAGGDPDGVEVSSVEFREIPGETEVFEFRAVGRVRAPKRPS